MAFEPRASLVSSCCASEAMSRKRTAAQEPSATERAKKRKAVDSFTRTQRCAYCYAEEQDSSVAGECPCGRFKSRSDRANPADTHGIALEEAIMDRISRGHGVAIALSSKGDAEERPAESTASATHG